MNCRISLSSAQFAGVAVRSFSASLLASMSSSAVERMASVFTTRREGASVRRLFREHWILTCDGLGLANPVHSL